MAMEGVVGPAVELVMDLVKLKVRIVFLLAWSVGFIGVVFARGSGSH